MDNTHRVSAIFRCPNRCTIAVGDVKAGDLISVSAEVPVEMGVSAVPRPTCRCGAEMERVTAPTEAGEGDDASNR